MPEDYFFFLEETDWCFRIREAGWEVIHIPSAHVIHIFGASTKKKIPTPTRIEYHRSLYHFFRKNRGSGRALLLQGFRALKLLLYMLVRIPLAPFDENARGRLRGDARIFAWHLLGQPAAWGLSGQRKSTEAKEASS